MGRRPPLPPQRRSIANSVAPKTCLRCQFFCRCRQSLFRRSLPFCLSSRRDLLLSLPLVFCLLSIRSQRPGAPSIAVSSRWVGMQFSSWPAFVVAVAVVVAFVLVVILSAAKKTPVFVFSVAFLFVIPQRSGGICFRPRFCSSTSPAKYYPAPSHPHRSKKDAATALSSKRHPHFQTLETPPSPQSPPQTL